MPTATASDRHTISGQVQALTSSSCPGGEQVVRGARGGSRGAAVSRCLWLPGGTRVSHKSVLNTVPEIGNVIHISYMLVVVLIQAEFQL